MSPTVYEPWLLSIREDNESLPSIEEQQAFLDFLNQKTTAEEAALAYTHVVTNAKHSHPIDLWPLVWQAAEEWAETHERLVDLLKAITRLPPISREGSGGETTKPEHWSPAFSFDLREHWDGEATGVICDSDPKIHTAFINLTSFSARLFRENLFDLGTFAIMTLKVALEEDYESQPQVLDTFISAAAQCILQTGQDVYQCDKEAISAGPLLEKAREKGSVERWGFWKEKFASVQDREDLKDSTRATGKQVVEEMEKIQKESS